MLDHLGQLPAGHDAAEAFCRITDAAYERRSVAVTSLTKGDSHRLAEALAGKGVILLAT